MLEYAGYFARLQLALDITLWNLGLFFKRTRGLNDGKVTSFFASPFFFAYKP